MDKEMLSKRIEILNRIELLKEKCECKGYDPKCDNCKKMARFGTKLNKLVAKRVPMNGEYEAPKVGKKKVEYPIKLTLQEYKYLRNLNLSDANIAKVFDTTEHFIRRFRDEHKIKKLKHKLKKNNAAEDKLAIKKIIIRERIRIKNLG